MAEPLDDAHLLRGLHAGVDRGVGQRPVEIVVAQVGQLPAGERTRGVVLCVAVLVPSLDLAGAVMDVHLPADGGGGSCVVAGDHDGADPCGVGPVDGVGGGVARWVQQPLQPGEHESGGFVAADAVRGVVAPAEGEREDSEAFVGEAVTGLRRPLLVERLLLAVGADPTIAHRRDAFGCALDRHEGAVVGLVDGGHEPLLGLERDPIPFLVAPADLGGVPSGLGRDTEQGHFHRIPDSGLLVGVLAVGFPGIEFGVVAQRADEQRRTQRPVVVDRVGDRRSRVTVAVIVVAEVPLAPAGNDPQHGHLVAGERAGLVRHDHRAAAEGVDGGQLLDDRVALGHPADADRQGHGDDHGETGGDRRHRERDCEFDHLGEVAADRQPEAHRHGGDRQDRDRDVAGELVDARFEWGLGGHGVLDLLGDLADLRRRAGGHDDAGAAAGGDRGRHEGHVPLVGGRQVRLVDRVGRLVDGDRFAGEW